MKSTLRIVALGAAITALVAPAARAATTREDYIAQVEPICQGALPSYLAAVDGARKALKHNDLETAALLFDDAANTFRETFVLVQQVEPPADDAALIGAWLALEFREVKAFHHYAGALREGKLRRAKRWSQSGQRINTLVDDLVGGYGFSYCS